MRWCKRFGRSCGNPRLERCDDRGDRSLKVLYVTKAMPFGAAEAFIFAEVEDHLAHGWDIWIAPVSRPPLVHRRGEALLSKTLAAPVFAPVMLTAIVMEFLRQPKLMLGTICGLLRSRPSLWPRNLAVWPKGVWLASKIRTLEIEHIHAHWIAVPATMGWIASQLTNVGFSVTCHRYDIAQRNLVAEKFAAAALIRAIDRPGAVELEQQIPSSEKRPEIIRMGVALPEADIKVAPGSLRTIRAIIGARLVEKKGHATLIRAVAIAQARGFETKIDAFGDGPLEAELQGLARELGVADLVRFCGNASHETLLEKLLSGDYDVAILPSVTTRSGDKEGIPVFLMEAMAAGVPVISTPNGGIAELIVPGTGILVPEYDEEALAGAIVDLATQESLRLQMAREGRRQVREQFSAEGCFARLRERIVEAVS